MDENGRNGGNWHLAQQITQLVIKPHIMQLSTTNHIASCITIIIAQIWGDFYFSYKYQKKFPHTLS